MLAKKKPKSLNQLKKPQKNVQNMAMPAAKSLVTKINPDRRMS
jgi:hypothetical protein